MKYDRYVKRSDNMKRILIIIIIALALSSCNWHGTNPLTGQGHGLNGERDGKALALLALKEKLKNTDYISYSAAPERESSHFPQSVLTIQEIHSLDETRDIKSQLPNGSFFKTNWNFYQFLGFTNLASSFGPGLNGLFNNFEVLDRDGAEFTLFEGRFLTIFDDSHNLIGYFMLSHYGKTSDNSDILIFTGEFNHSTAWITLSSFFLGFDNGSGYRPHYVTFNLYSHISSDDNYHFISNGYSFADITQSKIIDPHNSLKAQFVRERVFRNLPPILTSYNEELEKVPFRETIRAYQDTNYRIRQKKRSYIDGETLSPSFYSVVFKNEETNLNSDSLEQNLSSLFSIHDIFPRTINRVRLTHAFDHDTSSHSYLNVFGSAYIDGKLAIIEVPIRFTDHSPSSIKVKAFYLDDFSYEEINGKISAHLPRELEYSLPEEQEEFFNGNVRFFEKNHIY